MSNYPDGMPGRRAVDIDLECPAGHRWSVPGHYELGGYFVDNDEDCKYPSCGGYAKE